MAFNNIGPVTFLIPGASAEWSYSFFEDGTPNKDVGPQFACADIKAFAHHRTVVLLADQQRKLGGRSGTSYMVRITNQGTGISRHNLQGGGLT